MDNKNCIIFLNGDPPRKKVLKKYVKKSSFVLCSDGGANYISQYKLIPNAIIGDMDSIDKQVLKKFKKKNVEVIKIDEQETTDFEKSLNYCVQNNFSSVYVFGGASPRADHTLNNYSIMKRYYKRLNIVLIDNNFEISFINKHISFNYKKGKLVSLLPMARATGVTTRGLEFPLREETLELGVREGTLNRSTAKNVSISLKTGSLILFKKHFI